MGHVRCIDGVVVGVDEDDGAGSFVEFDAEEVGVVVYGGVEGGAAVVAGTPVLEVAGKR